MSTPSHENSSYVHGTGTTELAYLTIGAALERAAKLWPQRKNIVFCSQNLRWSCRDLDQTANKIAAGLITLDVQRGDRVAIWGPNSAEWLVSLFAIAKAGAIVVCVNPAYQAGELEYVLRKSGCKVLIAAHGFGSSHYGSIVSRVMPELATTRGTLNCPQLPQLRHVFQFGAPVADGMRPFADLAQLCTPESAAERAALAATLQADDPANIQFTSGTTGSPKGATLSHFSILNNARCIGDRLQLVESDRVCICLPLYHCSGIMQVLFSLWYGCTMIFPSAWFDATEVLSAVETERCSILSGVPTMFLAELEVLAKRNFELGTVRAGFIGGALPPESLMRRILAKLGIRGLTAVYGMTETSPVSFQSVPGTALETLISTVGRIHPHLEAKLVDSEQRVVPRGQAGEILTRGYSVMHGYWDDPQQTGLAIDEAGWMHTGDLGVLDTQGNLRIVGRLKDMIIRGGENVYPAEIEQFLQTHEYIRDVHVFGVPDERYGEEICAWIRPAQGHQLTLDAIHDFCRGHIASYKIPRLIRFVDEFPLTSTGKVQKFVMREMMQQHAANAGKK